MFPVSNQSVSGKRYIVHYFQQCQAVAMQAIPERSHKIVALYLWTGLFHIAQDTTRQYDPSLA